MKNKFTALVLTIAICFGIFPCIGIAATISADDAIGAMNAFGIIQPGELTDEKREMPIDRINFVILFAKLLGLDEQMSTDSDYYYDVPEDHWGKGSVNALVEKGILAVGDGYFRPEDTITKQEAARLVVTAIGRKGEADMKGGYPAGYMAVASEQKLFSGLESARELTYRDAAVLLYNTAVEEIVLLDFVQNRPAYSAGDETLLSLHYDIHYAEGMVNAVEGVSVDEHEVIRENQMIIGGETYNTDIWFYDYLGLGVKFFYKGEYDDKEIVYIFNETDDDNEVIITTSDYYEGFDGERISYYENAESTRTKSEKVYAGAVVIRNGEKASEDLYSSLNNVYGTIKFIRTGRFDGIDIVIIEDYRNILVSYVNPDTEVVYDKEDSSNPISLKEEDGRFVEYIDANGADASISSLTVGTLASVAVSASGKFVIVRTGNKVVGGNVTHKGYDAMNKPYIELDGVQYEVLSDIYTKYQNSIEYGIYVDLYLDAMGKVASISTEGSSEFSYAYIVKGFKSSEMNMVVLDGERVFLKIYTINGELKLVPCAEKIRIDNTMYKNCDAIMLALEESDEIKSQCVRIKYDAEGSIKVIDTIADGVGESDYSIRKMNTNDSNYKHWTGLIGADIYCPTSVPIMVVPPKGTEKSADRSKFAIKTVAFMTSDTSHKVDFFTTDPRSRIPEIGVLYQETATPITNTSPYYVVEKVTSVLNNDEEEALCLTLDNNGDSEYIVSSDYYSYQRKQSDTAWDHVSPYYNNIVPQSVKVIGPGDVIRFATNSYGEIDNIELVLDYSEAQASGNMNFFRNSIHPSKRLTAGSASGAQHGIRMTYGYVNEKIDDVFAWGYNSPTQIDEAYSSVIDTNKLLISVVDTENKTNKCVSGTIDDIISYYDSKVDFSRIITVAKDKVMTSLIIYK